MSTVSQWPDTATGMEQQALELEGQGRWAEAISIYERLVEPYEVPPARLCLGLARCYAKLADPVSALRWATAVIDATDDYGQWQAAVPLARKAALTLGPGHFRIARRLALLSTYTTQQWAPLLQLSAWRLGMHLDIYHANYNQYHQEILDPSSGLYQFQPEIVLLAPHAGALPLPHYTPDASALVEQEVARWAGLWQRLQERVAGFIIQHNFVIPPLYPFGHLTAKLAGCRERVIEALNRRLGELAGEKVAIVDCERIASLIGKQQWFDARYWDLAKFAVSPAAQPLLARHTAAVIAAHLGLSRKCIVVDLDNTLWGGVIGEDGLSGIRLGGGPEGEAFIRFQEYLLALKQRGILLAVCSKNNEADAREPFEKHPEMRLKLEDFSVFVANWNPKPENLRRISSTLNLGLDAFVFVDDSPAERQAVRRMLPEVDVLVLPEDPAYYADALSRYLLLEPVSFTEEDVRRTEMYRARAEVAAIRQRAGSLEEFYQSLQMTAEIGEFDPINLPRIAQLVAKTNQFNLTTRRHSLAQLQEFARNPDCVHFWVRLADCFADHGLIGVMIAFRHGEELEIDTWLMSCRVIGRTVEATMLAELCRRAGELGCRAIVGTYIPTAKNALVKEIYGQFGFEQVAEDNGMTRWRYDLVNKGPIQNPFIRVIHRRGSS